MKTLFSDNAHLSTRTAGGNVSSARSPMAWADYGLTEYGLTPDGVRERFAEYLRSYDATA